jgi:hypothetical protein
VFFGPLGRLEMVVEIIIVWGDGYGGFNFQNWNATASILDKFEAFPSFGIMQ